MLLTKQKLWELVFASFKEVNPVFMQHGKRVAYVVLRLCRERGYEKQTLPLVRAALFHEIGAFKTDADKTLFEFEAQQTYEHALGGYLFLKYFSPLGSDALPVLYHHAYCAESDGSDAFRKGLILHLADRFDVLYWKGEKREALKAQLAAQAGRMFDPADVETLSRLIDEGGLLEALDDGSYREALFEFFEQDGGDEVEFLRMLVFAFDVYSVSTVFHSSLTAAYGALLADAAGLRSDTAENVYYAGLIHDLGKIRTPNAILEKPGKLTTEEMDEMRRHVEHTRTLTQPYFDAELVDIAARHHERLDGGGYPDGLTAVFLDTPQRVLAVADVISALYTKRSYKDVFEAHTVRKILASMSEEGALDRRLVEVYLSDADAFDRRAQSLIENVDRRYTAAHEEYAARKDKRYGY